jgi:uncharacterized membrane protein YozB (DUF420 family)
MSARKPSYFFLIGVVGVLAVLIGFSRTFLVPMATGTFQAPMIIYIHGGFAFAWVLLFLGQAILIRKGQLPIHRRMGYAAAVVAFGAAVTMVPAGSYQIERDLAKGLGETAVSSIVGVITSAIIFFGLVIAGIIYRGQPQVHKRLMLWPHSLCYGPRGFVSVITFPLYRDLIFGSLSCLLTCLLSLQ